MRGLKMLVLFLVELRKRFVIHLLILFLPVGCRRGFWDRGGGGGRSRMLRRDRGALCMEVMRRVVGWGLAMSESLHPLKKPLHSHSSILLHILII